MISFHTPIHSHAWIEMADCLPNQNFAIAPPFATRPNLNAEWRQFVTGNRQLHHAALVVPSRTTRSLPARNNSVGFPVDISSVYLSTFAFLTYGFLALKY
jgi:hypothetical protein